MKVLQVLGGGPWGGGSPVVLAIARALIERGDEVWVASYDPEELRRFGDAGARLQRLAFWTSPPHPLDSIPFAQLLALCRRERFDLVVTHTSKGGFLGRIAARLAGIKHIIYHAHAFYFHQLAPGLRRRFYLELEKLATRAGDLIITVSEEHRQSGIRGGVEEPERIITIPNGVDLRQFQALDRATARQILEFDDSDLIVGSVGRLAAEKGYEHLLHAMPVILARHPAARLVIAGAGPVEEELRQEAALLGVEDRVTFLGFRRDVVGVLSTFDVFVQPSLREGLSVALLEAMATGRAIVASSISGNREAIDHGATGLLVPRANTRALAMAVCQLLDDPAHSRTLARNARRAARIRFSVDRMVEQHLNAYDRLLRPAPTAASSGRPIASGAVAGRST